MSSPDPAAHHHSTGATRADPQAQLGPLPERVPARSDRPPPVVERLREVGERDRPANAGQLGYTYTIYRFYDVDDRLLYLGRSERVRQRIVDAEIGHPRGLPLGHDDGPKPWWREAARIELEHLPPGCTEAEARIEERRQIEAFRPRYNREFNEADYDRSHLERAIDLAHFEVEVATAEHERHDGTVRSLDLVAIEAERAAERLRPAGAARLRYGARADGPGRRGAPGPFGDSASNATLAIGRRWRPTVGSFDGPGSIAGSIVVVIILIALAVAAVVVSVRVVF